MTYLQWVKEKPWRDIKIEDHCHGVRVSLREGIYGNDIQVTAVEATDSLAFHEALKALPDAKKRKDAERIKKKKEKLTEARAKVRELNREIKEMENKDV
jgi:RNA binding exosome subunit